MGKIVCGKYITTTEICKHLQQSSDAQLLMAANSLEDRTFWHHIYISDLMLAAEYTIRHYADKTIK